MDQDIVLFGTDTSTLLTLSRQVEESTGQQPGELTSLQAAWAKLSDETVDTLIVDLDSVQLESTATELLNFLEWLPSSGMLRRLLVVCRSKISFGLAPLFEVILACRVRHDDLGDSLKRLLTEPSSVGNLVEMTGFESRSIEAAGHCFTTQMEEMFPLLDQLKRIAVHDAAILLIGETGTGKSHLANIVHALSPRSGERFVNTACGALPPSLIESELFGHTRGAFTGADRNKVGRFEVAQGGTLLLDEIDTLGPSEQAKLLRVIETGEFEPVGSNETRHTDVRLIAASNVDLRELAARNEFRSDLFYRMSVLEFHLLPLRDRSLDIVPLAAGFISQAATERNVPIKGVDIDFLNRLKTYTWPGNVRELRNQMSRAVMLSHDGILSVDTLSPSTQNAVSLASENSRTEPTERWQLGKHMFESERQLLQSALEAHDNNRSATAKALGVSRAGLYKKMSRLGISSSNSITNDR
ncbi:MAG: transcriptional regulator with PAS, ATPase and Fis domain [Porticoccaceae bacterium]|jgi:transcriptional regulator with PAS, ATPase and Fis domain